jgi:hypothetical protein
MATRVCRIDGNSAEGGKWFYPTQRQAEAIHAAEKLPLPSFTCSVRIEGDGRER